MSAFRALAALMPRLLPATWVCDNCYRVNSDSVVTCTGCGA